MKPLRDEVVIKQQSRENKTEAGIILTTDVAIKENVGEVVAFGSKAEELESYNFLTAQPEYADIGQSQIEDLQKQYPGRGTVDLSMFSITTPAEISEQQFEDEYGNVVEATQNAKQVRKMQQDMLTYMFGG